MDLGLLQRWSKDYFAKKATKKLLSQFYAPQMRKPKRSLSLEFILTHYVISNDYNYNITHKMENVKMKNEKDYVVGIDIGTNSIGWAVLNMDYTLMKLKHHHAWGAFLFNDGKTAQSRRVSRSARTHYRRRALRVEELQMLMADDVLSVDDSFFIKLKQSYLHNLNEDPINGRKNHYNLFEGEFTDKDYYALYPTIYHLRDALMTEDRQFDIRLVYLALHHIIKYRGNFLQEGDNIETATNIESVANEYFDEVEEKLDIRVDCDIVEKTIDILQDKAIKKGAKLDKIKENCADPKIKEIMNEFAKAVLGYKFSTKKLFQLEEILIKKDDNKEETISFDKFEENADSYYPDLGDEYAELLKLLLVIYNTYAYSKIMRGQNTISKAMIATYEKHKKDLKILKEVFRADKNLYKDFFKSPNGENYVNYVNTNTSSLKAMGVKVKRENFYTHLKVELAKFEDSDQKAYILSEIEEDNFLPKLNDVSNSLVPYQKNLEELRAIINNQSKYYPTLATNGDKIEKILTFKRPYYVGKLKGEFSWNKQVIGERLYSWNFEELVDYKPLAQEFITRMTNRCRYFPSEECLPLQSIYYQAYVCLNELNGVRVCKDDAKKNNEFTNEMKQKVFLDLFCNRGKKTIKVKDFVNYLNEEFKLNIQAENVLGLAEEDKFLGNMSTLVELKKRLGDKFNKDDIDKYEELAKHLTIFEDKKARKEKVRELFPDAEEKQVESLSNIKCEKWGRYSKKFLHGILTSKRKSVLQTLWDEKENINHIIFDEKLGILDQVENGNKEIEKFDYKKDIEPLYCSPSVKKAIWNTCKILEEIVSIVGCEPKYIFVETTKEDDVKKKAKSRDKMLEELYKDIQTEAEKYGIEYNKECMTKLGTKSASELEDKIYLWFSQLGRCMYTGEIIPYDDVINNNCEIDHIVPRHYIKDDSLSNRVLVKKIENQKKSGTLALSFEVRTNMQKFWEFLYRKRFITGKKFRALNKADYNDNDMTGFVNRQLVETSQAVKEINNLLEARFGKTTIKGVKAKMNSLMRETFVSGIVCDKKYNSFYKLRQLNDLHHAKDAYLTAVVGMFTSIAYPMWGNDSQSIYIKRMMSKTDDVKKFDELVNKRYGLIMSAMVEGDLSMFTVNEDGEYNWDDIKLNNVLTTMDYNDCLIVKQKNFEAETAFYKDSLQGRKQKNNKLQPRKYVDGKPLDTQLYGGYTGENDAYYCVVSYKKGKNVKYELIGIPVMKAIHLDKLNSKDKKTALKQYIDETKNIECNLEKIVYKNQKIVVDGCPYYITSSVYRVNAVQMKLDSKYNDIIKQVEKYNKEKEIGQFSTINDLRKDEESTTLKLTTMLNAFSTNIDKYYSNYGKSGLGSKIKDYVQNGFLSLSLENKLLFTFKILKLGRAESCQLNLKNICGSAFPTGLGMITSKYDLQQIDWIDESMTGLYKKVYKIGAKK